MRTHEYEPIPGLPEELPEGEEILWQGKPAWWSLTKRALHVRKVAAYFVIVGTWFLIDALLRGEGVPVATGELFSQLLVGALACGLLAIIGRWMANTTLYTITNRRVVMRIGAALPTTVNLPYSKVEEANLRHFKDGTSDIPIRLYESEQVRFLMFWPHARPWHLSRPEPALRAIPDGDQAARVLAEALEAHRAQEGQGVAEGPADSAEAGLARETS